MTIFGHRKGSGRVSDKTGAPGGYRNPPGGLMGLMGLMWRRGRGFHSRPRAPSPPSPNWTRREGGAPLSFLSSLPSFPPPTPTRKRGSPTPGGSRTPPWRALPWPAASSSLAPLYTGAGGHPMTHKFIYGSFLSHVRCPPPPYSTSIISSRSLGEALRR